MKKSEELLKQSSEEDNDLKALGLQTKAIRERRNENFEENWLEKIKNSENVLNFNTIADGYRLTAKVYGMLSFYPKSNKVLIHSQNKWIKPGLQWLIKNLL